MSNQRRFFLKTSIILGSYSLATTTGFIAPATTQADWIADFFSAGTLDESVKKVIHIPDVSHIELSDKIALKLPSIAENGAVVPITIETSLAQVEQIFVFVEKNPIPLTSVFSLSPNVDPVVSTRLKVSETSTVMVIVKAEGKMYKAEQEVKVTVGGCGG